MGARVLVSRAIWGMATCTGALAVGYYLGFTIYDLRGRRAYPIRGQGDSRLEFGTQAI
jgi:hypothetical protein